MADIASFPVIAPVESTNGPTFSFKSNGAIKAGMVVSFEATGVSLQVIPCVAGAGTWPVGVAQADAASGSYVAVQYGGIANVANADDTTGTDAGDWLEMNDNAVGGTVSAAAIAASGATATPHWVIGYAVEDIAGGGTGKVMICPQCIIQVNAS